MSAMEEMEKSGGLKTAGGKAGRGLRHNPVLVPAIAVLAVFMIEVLVMVMLNYLPRSSWYMLPLVDAILLAFLAFPIIYLLMSRAIGQYISRCELFRREIEGLREELDELKKKVRQAG